ncbi:toll/interleukin-1 receptor domain-containing protein [Actinomycetospora aeridis]|uniref:Toll/interleukin-1 receptor domain-containing protein n=1 Tax=Actinomycetospora aeridis TaxID=3129231 RepID=A0ABU8N326_9PSEU
MSLDSILYFLDRLESVWGIMLRRKVFLSYSREDREAVGRLHKALESLRCEVWLDQELSGGEVWWREILGRIGECDAVAIAISASALRSRACLDELGYAVALGRPILPVLLEAVPFELLPSSVASVQAVDFTGDRETSALALASAVFGLPPAPNLPTPLPPPPPTPLSYLTTIADVVGAPALSVDEQFALAARLEAARETQADLPVIRALCAALLEREDLYHSVAKRVQKIASSIPDVPRPDSRPPVRATSAPRPSARSGLPSGWTGIWEGEVSEHFFPPYPVVLTLHAPDERSGVGEFEYPSLGVAGWLKFIRVKSGDVRLQEHATERRMLLKSRLRYSEATLRAKFDDAGNLFVRWEPRAAMCRATLTRRP